MAERRQRGSSFNFDNGLDWRAQLHSLVHCLRIVAGVEASGRVGAEREENLEMKTEAQSTILKLSFSACSIREIAERSRGFAESMEECQNPKLIASHTNPR